MLLGRPMVVRVWSKSPIRLSEGVCALGNALTGPWGVWVLTRHVVRVVLKIRRKLKRDIGVVSVEELQVHIVKVHVQTEVLGSKARPLLRKEIEARRR